MALESIRILFGLEVWKLKHGNGVCVLMLCDFYACVNCVLVCCKVEMGSYVSCDDYDRRSTLLSAC